MVYLLPHTIERAAEQFPDQDAFRCANRALTYAGLARQMGQLSRLLIETGVQKGDRVGVYMNRSLETATAVYGIMNAGAAFVPLDPEAPPARTRFLLQDCGIQHLITNPSQRNSLKQVLTDEVTVQTVIGLREDWPVPTISWEEVAQMPATRPSAVRMLEQDLAYIMYTSGTTGAPKGIMHTHYSGLSYARLSAALYGLNEKDRIGNHAALHFDISTLGYFTSPLVAATTVIIPDAHTKMPASLSKLMEDEQLTVWYSVPLALVQLLQQGVLEQRDLSRLRWVLFGGEPFPAKHLRSLMQWWPQARFSNVYGPAEVNQCTYYHVPAPPPTDEPIPLGRVWANTEMRIVDEQDQPVKMGEPGELLIRSATRMKGYWRRPDLTEKGFFRRTTTSGYEEIFYRTGDLVRLDPAGNLLFLGRKDRQIKTRGYRVELDEVEAVLMAHPAVEAAAVFPVRHGDEGLLIQAAVTLKDKAAVDEMALRNHVGASIPWYAVPQNITFTQMLPRTAAGKINYTQLQIQAENK